MHLRVTFSLILFSFFHIITLSQSALGTWGDHLSYLHVIRINTSANKIICATTNALFTVDVNTNNIERLSKINGLSEVGVVAMETDALTGKTIIAYSNSNLDLLNASGIINLDDLKRSRIAGDKTVNDIFFYNSRAYLSAGFGIVVIDLERNEVKENYIIGSGGKYVKVNQVTSTGLFFYAATAEGLKRAPTNAVNLSDYRNWEPVNDGWSPGVVEAVIAIGNAVVLLQSDTLYINENNTWKILYSSKLHITALTVSAGKLAIVEKNDTLQARIVVLNKDGSISKVLEQSGLLMSPQDVLLKDESIWIADSISGLLQYVGNDFKFYRPNAPNSNATGEMFYHEQSLWVTPGVRSINYENDFSENGFFKFKDQGWTNYTVSILPALDSIYDVVTIAVSSKDHSVWLGSLGGGLVRFAEPVSLRVYKQQSGIVSSLFQPLQYRVTGLAFDEGNNLWISNYGAAASLVVRKDDGNFKSFPPPISLTGNAVSSIIIDEVNQKWIVSPEGNGLLAFNHGSSIDNPGDDRWKLYRAGKGNGNLPDNQVLSVALDKSGFIWVGTSKGIGIIQCPQQVFSQNSCEAVLPVVQQDNFAGYLFSNEEVQTIAVNGADQKWVGSKNGAWLISSDGSKTIHHFTAENSPLFSNDVRKIIVDPKTGDVFFATSKGLCSFRGNAVEGNRVNEALVIYPNPVPPGYNGSIAIRGMVSNSIIKITELDGRLVFQTRSSGGLAIWNGRDYKGRQVSSGIYLVIVSNESRQEKAIGKIVFVNR